MARVLFSVSVGRSMAHVFRTRQIARHLRSSGHDVIYMVPSRAFPFLKGYLDPEDIVSTDPSAGSQLLYTDLAEKESRCIIAKHPDIIVADKGLILHAYLPSLPVIKILNRFDLERAGLCYSAFNDDQLGVMRAETEAVINAVRIQRGLPGNFLYGDFAKAPVIVNGDAIFTEDLCSAHYFFPGVHLEMRCLKVFKRQRSSCFVFFGTGLNADQCKLFSKTLALIEPLFRRIYISSGLTQSSAMLYEPQNACVKQYFDHMPEDVGLVICHGGYGICHSAVLLGLPVICLPISLETFSNSEVVQRANAGVNVGMLRVGDFLGGSHPVDIDWEKFESALENVDSLSAPMPVPIDPVQHSAPLPQLVARAIASMSGPLQYL